MGRSVEPGRDALLLNGIQRSIVHQDGVCYPGRTERPLHLEPSLLRILARVIE